MLIMSCSTTSLESFAYETNITSLGRLEIKPLVSADEIQPACTVMVRAFSGGEEQLTLTGVSYELKKVY